MFSNGYLNKINVGWLMLFLKGNKSFTLRGITYENKLLTNSNYVTVISYRMGEYLTKDV